MSETENDLWKSDDPKGTTKDIAVPSLPSSVSVSTNAPLPSSLNQKLIEQAVQSGIHQGDLMLEVMGNIIAQRVSDGIESGAFQQNVKYKMKGVMNRLLPNLPQSEQEKKIEQIGENDELIKFIDSLVSVRLEHDQKLLDNRQKQEKLKQLEQKRQKKEKQEKLETVNNWFFIFLISVGLFTSGLLIGINVLPHIPHVI